jgi:hypothetical protein
MLLLFQFLLTLTIHIHDVHYRIAGNFRGVQFSQMANLQSFRSLIFTDALRSCPFYMYMYTAQSYLFRGSNFRG